MKQHDSTEQDLDKVTHAPVIDSALALVDWWTSDAGRIEQFSRATAHQVCLILMVILSLTNDQKPIFTYAFDSETTLQLHDVAVVPQMVHNKRLRNCGDATMNQATGCLEVQCASGSQLAVKGVKQRNRKLMASKEWWVGIPAWKRPGDLLRFHMGPSRNPEIHPEFHSVHNVARH